MPRSGRSYSISVTRDGLEVEGSYHYFGGDEPPLTIRWTVTVTRLGESQPLFQARYGTPSIPATADEVSVPFPLPPDFSPPELLFDFWSESRP